MDFIDEFMGMLKQKDTTAIIIRCSCGNKIRLTNPDNKKLKCPHCNKLYTQSEYEYYFMRRLNGDSNL